METIWGEWLKTLLQSVWDWALERGWWLMKPLAIALWRWRKRWPISVEVTLTEGPVYDATSSMEARCWVVPVHVHLVARKPCKEAGLLRYRVGNQDLQAHQMFTDPVMVATLGPLEERRTIPFTVRVYAPHPDKYTKQIQIDIETVTEGKICRANRLTVNQ